MALLAMHVIALHAIIAAVTPLGGNSTYITLQLVTVESSATQRGANSASVQREKNASHYGDPKTGCLPGEISARIVGVKGDVCAPPCNGLDKLCPKDVPAGATATPLCTLLVRARICPPNPPRGAFFTSL